ncbi:MAG: transposase [Burkholderiales bacterium]|nr:transposase [Burkholderiales bacterium]
MQHNRIITANRVIYQQETSPELYANFGYLTNNHEQLIQILDLIDLDVVYPRSLWDKFFGRPGEHRHRFLIAFIARIVWNIRTTKDLIAYLRVDRALRLMCGFDGRKNKIPSESSFSREFKQLSSLNIPGKIHEQLILSHCSSELYEHSAIDASSIEVAERAVKTKKVERTVAAQRDKSTQEIILDLPSVCNFGTKKNSNGKGYSWKGYKLHAVVNEYNVPVAALVTSASVHDSLCAIPLFRIAESRVDGLYYLMDKGYDAVAIRDEISEAGKIALIDFKANRNSVVNGEFIGNQIERYKKRTFAESHFSHVKLRYLPRYILYRGIDKVRGLLNLVLSVITAVQIVKYA